MLAKFNAPLWGEAKLEDNYLDFSQARWLSVHPHFNANCVNINYPSVETDYELELVCLSGVPHVRFKFKVSDKHPLWQANLSEYFGASIGNFLQWTDLEGSNDTAVLDVPRSDLQGIEKILFQVTNSVGGISEGVLPFSMHVNLWQENCRIWADMKLPQ